MKGKCVIKIGGSILFNENKELDLKKIKEFCDIFENALDSDTVVVICGGGIIAREYINAVRSIDENEAVCDTFGIELSRINAKLIISFLKEKAYPLVPKSVEELSHAMLFKKIIAMGGLQPGQSTTSVAVEVAEFINVDHLVILTDVEGIYDKDPKKYENAKLIPKLSYRDLQDLILSTSGDKQASAGEYRIFDTVSLQLLKRSKIEAHIMSGIDLDQFRKFWNGDKNVIGTRIAN